ncbi:MAG: N-acetyltransferase family protein [Bacteroidota bacterium]
MPIVYSTARGEVLIRPAAPADALAYRELRLEALKNHPTGFGASYEESLKHPLDHWEQRMRMDSEKEVLFLAEHRHELIGMTGLYRNPSPEYKHTGTVWGVYVRQAWRGLHVAEALIRACLDWARAKGMVIAKLGVTADNLPAIRCYERCGFKTYGIEPRARYHQGRYLDGCLMACPLEGT